MFDPDIGPAVRLPARRRGPVEKLERLGDRSRAELDASVDDRLIVELSSRPPALVHSLRPIACRAP